MKKQLIFYLALLGLTLSACEDNVVLLELPSREGTLSIEYCAYTSYITYSQSQRGK